MLASKTYKIPRLSCVFKIMHQSLLVESIIIDGVLIFFRMLPPKTYKNQWCSYVLEGYSLVRVCTTYEKLWLLKFFKIVAPKTYKNHKFSKAFRDYTSLCFCKDYAPVCARRVCENQWVS